MEKKRYYVVDLMHVDGIDKTPDSLHLVDRVHKRILYFSAYHDCKDVTAAMKRIYATDKDKSWMDRRLGCELVKILDDKDAHKESVVLLATDDAREATRKVASVRARWFSIHAERLERTAASESAGWGDTADDDFIAEHFIEL